MLSHALITVMSADLPHVQYIPAPKQGKGRKGVQSRRLTRSEMEEVEEMNRRAMEEVARRRETPVKGEPVRLSDLLK